MSTIRLQALLLLAAIAPEEAAAFSSIATSVTATSSQPPIIAPPVADSPPPPQTDIDNNDQTEAEYEPRQRKKDRPLLRQFGRNINERILNSKGGKNRFGLEGGYSSDETIPTLNMQCDSGGNSDGRSDGCDDDISSRRDIREAYTADNGGDDGTTHGRSSGSGCAIIRLKGEDAKSVRGLVDFADDFFEGTDNDESNSINHFGVFRIANNVHAGFDRNVNGEGKMQVLYTKLIPSGGDGEDPLLLLEVGELVGPQSLKGAHEGMNALFDIGSQITSAVLGMDGETTAKLLDDCTPPQSGGRDNEAVMHPDDADEIAFDVSNSYQRLIRYLEPRQQTASGADAENDEETDAAFWPHVDSTFLTLIPMSEIPGLEVWCPSSENAESSDLAQRGEWVRPSRPTIGVYDEDESITGKGDNDDEKDCAYVFALAGEFLQLLSDGRVPTCIHRVIPPRPPSPSLDAFNSFAPSNNGEKYKPRVSAPLFVRPRRGEEAILEYDSTIMSEEERAESRGLYFEEGLMEECDGMLIWDYMTCMSPNN